MSGRSSNAQVPKRIRKILDSHEEFSKLFPQFYSYSVKKEDDFRGVSFILADSGGVLAIFKRFGDDGSPEVMFSHGEDLLECFLAGEKALASGKWKPDPPRKPS